MTGILLLPVKSAPSMVNIWLDVISHCVAPSGIVHVPGIYLNDLSIRSGLSNNTQCAGVLFFMDIS